MTPFLIGPGRVEYSSIRASNGKYILLQQLHGEIELYGINGAHIRTLPAELRTSTGVVLDWTDDDHAYCIGGNQLWRRHLITDAVEMIAHFPEYVGLVSQHIEGDLTKSGYLALCGVDDAGVESVFAYNVLTRKAGDAHAQREAFDGLKVAEDGALILSKGTGIFAIPPVGVSYPIASVNGHACPAVHQGRPVLLWCTSADSAIDDNAVARLDIKSGTGPKLASFNWAYAIHISAGPDFAIVSLYDPEGKLPFEIWKVPFDGSTGALLHQWNGPYRGYDSSPKATYSGGLILYNVDDGNTVSVWGLRLDGKPVEVPAGPPPSPVETRIDYSAFVGQEFIMRPRADGAVDIFQRKKP